MRPSKKLSGYETWAPSNDATVHHNQTPQRPTNVYQQQTPARPKNSKDSFSGSPFQSSVPSVHKNSLRDRAPAAHSSYFEPEVSTPTTFTRWEDATMSEFQVPAYKHEPPSCLYKSRFSANPRSHDLRDKPPRVWSPSDSDSDDATGDYVAGSERREARADSSRAQKGVSQARTGGRAPRSAEQKARIARGAANRRAKDRDSLATIKGRLPPLAYGEEYNNGTALLGAIHRFDRDEERISALRIESASYQRRWRDTDAQLTSERRYWDEERKSLIGQRDSLRAQWDTVQSTLDGFREKLARQDAECQNAKTLLMEKEIQLATARANRENLTAKVQHTEAELRYWKRKDRPTRT
ncbi:hypothetical protein DENSPDRAFT_537289 [Dentipellis sp. KUC8613]|nr:hypothetical protein DENSPDRAFT_537289 [Dentipellis sp. KUC8613]